MGLTPGTRLGSYEVLSSVGAGGMGEVYRARDTKLGRDVAIKVLAPALGGDPAALARFEREATSVARLSHPNILAIYEFARSTDGTPYVVTEFVEGDTLRARLSNGPLPPRRAVTYAQQIARGIAAAHARGIVHRDLKPENVMIGRDDHVKILDFGLAKPIETRPGDETHAVSVKTSAGTVLGTFAYMAPEQVRGLDVDHRADIFAFGAVLYEMLSGERAFKGETAADTMTAILTKEPPDLDVAKLAIAPALERIVRRCLEKSPDLRFQSANDLAFALETLSSASTPSGSSAPVTAMVRGGRIARIPWLIAGAAAAAAVAIWLRPSAAAAPMLQQFTQLTDAAGEETAPAISPDGSTVLYQMRVNGRWGIYAQRVGGRNATPIIVDPQHDFGAPAYSPDGGSIAYHDGGGGIFVAGATGESARRLTDGGFNPAWSPDGKSIAYATEESIEPASRNIESPLFVVDASGGTPRRLVDGDGMQPVWSPSGKRIAYWSNTRGQRDIFTVAAAGGPRVAVTNDIAIDWSPAWSPDGRYLYFASDRGGSMNLWRTAIDETTGKRLGEPEPVTNGVQASAAWGRFSKDGSRLVFRSAVRTINPVAIPFDPATGRAGVPRVLDGSNNIRIPSDVSPDGREIVYYSLGARQEDVFIGSADGTKIRHLTDDAARDRAPMFTRDGKSIVFYSTRDGNWDIWTMRTDGSNLRKVASNPNGCVYAVASPVDDTIVFSSAIGENAGFLVRPSGSGFSKPEPLANTTTPAGAFNAMSFSRDGTRLVGVVRSEAGGPVGVAVYDLRAHSLTRWSDDVSFGVHFLPGDRQLIYFTGGGGSLVILDTVTGERRVVNVPLPAPAFDDVWGLAPDGRTIYYGAVRVEGDIWIAQR